MLAPRPSTSQPELARMKVEQCQIGSIDIIRDTGHLVCLEKPQETGKQRPNAVYIQAPTLVVQEPLSVVLADRPFSLCCSGSCLGIS